MPRHQLSPFEIQLRQTISNNLKKYSRNFSQQQLSEMTGIPASTISGYFSQRSTPNPGAVQKLADAMNVSKSDIDPRFNTDIKPASKSLPTHSYQYVPADISAGVLSTVDAVTESDLKSIDIPDAFMGSYVGDKDITMMHVNGKSMNHVIPDGSVIGVKRIDDVSDLKDGDIVVFSEDGEDYAVKRFYNDKASETYVFNPDSTESCYRPILRRYEDSDGLSIIGRVVVYVVTL